MSVGESTTTMIIDISGIEAGLYLVRIRDRSGTSSVQRLLIN